MHAGSRSLAVRHAPTRCLHWLLNAPLALLLAWEVLAIGYFPLLSAPAR